MSQFAPKKLEIIRLGEVIRSVESTGPGQKELSLDFEIDADDGFWITARVEGYNSTGALATPVYVVRPALLKRVEEAREIYRKLKEETAAKEKLIRNKR